MATNPRIAVTERNDLTLVADYRKKRSKPSNGPMGRLISTFIALVLLIAVLRYLPPVSRGGSVQATPLPVQITPDDLRLVDVQMIKAPAGDALYLDGTITNTGKAAARGATVEVSFHDPQGNLVGSMQRPVAGMAGAGADVSPNSFKNNPIQPKEMRFFRVAVEQVPTVWNHQVPEVKVVSVSAR